MIYNQTTQKSKELLSQKRSAFLREEKELSESNPQAVNYFRNAELDRFDNEPASITSCNCSTTDNAHGAHGAFMAFPNDTAQFLLCCVACGEIHTVGEK